MHWNHMLKAGVAIVALAGATAQAANSNGVSVTIAPEKTTLGKSDNVVVKVTITNTSSSPQYVLKWHTPFAEIEESLFDITRDGVKVNYLGAHYKRQAPTAADYYLLKPGASHTARVELSDIYDMSVTGEYSIRYNAKSMSLFSTQLAARGVVGAEKQLGELESAPVSLYIDGLRPRGSASQDAELMAKPGGPTTPPSGSGLTFSKCTTAQQSEIMSAVSAATTMANGADAYMSSGTPGARYNKWFGANDSARIATVKANFIAIKDAFLNKPVTVDCGCKKTYYAYVYPTQPYKIYVCKAFWTAPMTGTDSKGGTLVHEMSHFNATAGTDDWVYGQSGAASLAISDPAKAIDNADSHEYFSENTPAL